MPFNFGDIPLILQELRRYFASKAQGTLADSALQPGAIGSTVQAYHARLDSLSGITNTDGGIEKTGANTYGRYALTTFGKSLVDDADASTARSTLGLTIGSNVQAWDANLDAIAAITGTGFLERTGSNSWGVSYTPSLSSLNGGQLAGTRNRIINGGMAIDQRTAGASRSFTAGAALSYGVDRWYGYCTGANVTGQQIQGASPGLFRYQFTGATGVTAIGFGQRIERANCAALAGTTATLSVDLANSLLTTVTWTAFYATTTDTFGTLASPTRTQIATGTFTVSSTVTRYNAQISIPSAANTGIEIVFSVGAQISGTWIIGDVQLEPGTLATPFERRSIGLELALCQRYYQEIDGEYRFDMYANPTNGDVTVGGMWYFFVPMRVLPTVAVLSQTSTSTSVVSTITVKSAYGASLTWSLLNTSGVTPRTKAVIISALAEL